MTATPTLSTDIATELAAIAAGAAAADSAARDAIAAARLAAERTGAPVPAEPALAALAATVALTLANSEARYRSRRATIAQAAQSRRRTLRDQVEHQADQLVAGDHARIAADDARLEKLRARTHEALASLAAKRRALEQAVSTLRRQARRIAVAAPADLSAADPAAPAPTVPLAIDAALVAIAALPHLPAYRACRPLTILGRHLLSGALAAAVIQLTPLATEALLPTLGLAGVGAALIALRTRARRRTAARHITALQAQAQDQALLIDGQCAHLRRSQGGSLPDRAARILAQDEALARARSAVERQTAPRIAALRIREEAVIARLDARHARHRDQLQAWHQAQAVAIRSRAQHEQDEAEHGLQRRLDAIAAGQSQDLAALAERWRACAARLTEAVVRAAADSHARHPAWGDMAWATWAPPLATLPDLPAGLAHTSLRRLAGDPSGPAAGFPDAALTAPLSLAWPGGGPLLLECSSSARTTGIDAVVALCWRALAATAPGRLRLTLVDPQGLGAAFSGLLTLAGQDEGLIPEGVLADTNRIDRAFDGLIAHVERIIQTCLRGTHADIAAYNRGAGALAEPLHLVVLVDAPAGLGPRALERLGALARGGARCGVHLAVVAETLTRDLLPLTHAPGALHLRWRDDAWRIATGPYAGWDATPEQTPGTLVATRLGQATGPAARAARRVEVPFTRIAAATPWQADASAGLSIPLGLSGAERVLALELGRGTAQHVLIGGRTGSGKSTLFHILIAAAALAYHPDELDLHLIDFKKGVEFQAYGDGRLPHVRVLAMESDREFGLDVLRHLDAELARRGALFRSAGVQDLAGLRRSGQKLPRILLLIDEFQELFTEDDGIAHEAALLLDRFVRQGRAFGMHVVLGSQTLGGAYAMARSSLGQMGVRIVLPCSDADAQLLLDEGNDGARHLRRPGDALYNDQAGRADGNRPFQVCWLDEAGREAVLDRCAALTRAAGWRPVRPPVIFAGGTPARWEDEPALLAPFAVGEGLSAVIGQASAMAGAARLELPESAGGNLLVVGNQRQAAAATLAALALGTARAGGRVLVADGDGPDGSLAAILARFAGYAGLPTAAAGGRAAIALVEQAATVLEARLDGRDASRTPLLLVLHALPRLRDLHVDDAAYPSPGAEPAPGERLGRILSDGPACGVHVAIWCDALAAAVRAIGRRRLRDLGLRVLFAMGANDATELADDPSASRLGLHQALLADLGSGRRAKFRPFDTPSAEFIAMLPR